MNFTSLVDKYFSILKTDRIVSNCLIDNDSFDLSSFERKNFTDALSKDRDVVGRKINPSFV